MTVLSPFRSRIVVLALAPALALMACSRSTAPLEPPPDRVLVSGRPYGIASLASGSMIVSLLDGAATTRVSPPDWEPSGELEVGYLPTDVALNRLGTRAYVANQYDQTISVIDVAGNATIATFEIPGDPFKVAASPDGASLYVGTNRGYAYKLNAASGTILDSISTGATPFGFAFGSGSTMYISTWAQGTVLEVNSATMSLLRTFVTEGIAQELAISADLRELYVANEGRNRVEVWNIASGIRSASIAVEGGPFGLLLEPDGSHLWASLSGTGRVAVIDRVLRVVDTTYQVGGRPRRLAYDARRKHVAVTNESGWIDFLALPRR